MLIDHLVVWWGHGPDLVDGEDFLAQDKMSCMKFFHGYGVGGEGGCSWRSMVTFPRFYNLNRQKESVEYLVNIMRSMG